MPIQYNITSSRLNRAAYIANQWLIRSIYRARQNSVKVYLCCQHHSSYSHNNRKTTKSTAADLSTQQSFQAHNHRRSERFWCELAEYHRSLSPLPNRLIIHIWFYILYNIYSYILDLFIIFMRVFEYITQLFNLINLKPFTVQFLINNNS